MAGTRLPATGKSGAAATGAVGGRDEVAGDGRSGAAATVATGSRNKAASDGKMASETGNGGDNTAGRERRR